MKSLSDWLSKACVHVLIGFDSSRIKIAQIPQKNTIRLKNKTIIQPEEEVVSPLIIVVVSLLILGLCLALFILILPSRIYNCMMRGTIFEDQPQKGYKHIQNV